MTPQAKTNWMDLLGRQIIRPKQGTIRKERELILRLVVCILLYAVAATVCIWIHLQNIEMGYGLARISKVHDELLQKRGELQVELEMLMSPQRIARIAEQELGMGPPDPHDMVIVK